MEEGFFVSGHVFCTTNMAFGMYRLFCMRVLIPSQFSVHIFEENNRRANYSLGKKIEASSIIIHAHSNFCIGLHALIFHYCASCWKFKLIVMPFSCSWWQQTSPGISLPWGKRRWNWFSFGDNITLRFYIALNCPQLLGARPWNHACFITLISDYRKVTIE